jgi:RHS repeat-associated protein
MLRVYQEAGSRTEEYQYDPAGNRTYQKITLVQASTYISSYYANSDRLKTDGKFAFKYDNAGNLTVKGNTYTINGDNVTFTKTSGEGVEYWQYRYDLLNRLVEVKKNGTVVAEYGYSPDGLRQVKRTNGATTHYVFQGTEPIFEKRISDGRTRSYVYAGTKLIARVDGVIGDANAAKYFYHTDHLGSVKAVTKVDGSVVWKADYLPFGQQYMKNKLDTNFEEDDLGFTGKNYDKDTGLYYFNARWYDSELGRFISEDPSKFGKNYYIYCKNNSLLYVDPSGRVHVLAAMAVGGIYGFASTLVMDALNGQGFSDPETYISNIAAGAISGGAISLGADPWTASALGAVTANGLKYAIYSFEGKTNPPIGEVAVRTAFDTAIGGIGGTIGTELWPRGPGREPTGFISSLTGKVGQNVLWGQGGISGAVNIYGEKTWQTMKNNGWLNYSNNSSSSSSGTFTYSNGMDNIATALGDNPNASSIAATAGYTVQYINGFCGQLTPTLNENGDIVQTGYIYVEGGYLFVNSDGTTNFVSDEDQDGEPYTGPYTTGPVITSTTPTSNDGTGSSTTSTSNDGTGSGTTSSGGSIICTELHRQGLMPDDIYRADEAFGKLLREKCPLVLKGYYFWARPVVQHMRESKAFTKIVHMIAKPWYLEMAHIIDKKHEGSFAGKMLMVIGIPICGLIGLMISNKLLILLLLLTCIIIWCHKYLKKFMYYNKRSNNYGV